MSRTKITGTGLDIDNATDIGAAIVDADLFIMDDGAGGTIRKTTASRIKTYVGGSDPSSADGDSLGTASLEWSDLYLADGGVIYFGNDQDITITHNPDAGVTLGGTTPTLTMGDAGAEDTKIVFDGNEKDFYVGLDDSENKLIIGRGSAVGTNNILTIIDDEISIGDGSAVDTKIRWDGNAQDYYIGLDDTDDDFKIGKGATVGTTAAIIINEAPSFSSYNILFK